MNRLQFMHKYKNTIKEWLNLVPGNRHMAKMFQTILLDDGPCVAFDLLKLRNALISEFGNDTQ